MGKNGNSTRGLVHVSYFIFQLCHSDLKKSKMSPNQSMQNHQPLLQNAGNLFVLCVAFEIF